jgi:hypothetical protein
MILSARAGIGEKPIEMKLKVLKRMQYFVKTAYGLSSNSFQNTFLRYVFGLLQGSSEVCPIWSLSSSIQFEVMDKQYPMAVFPSPRPEVSTERNGESFVDDTTLWVTSMTASLQEVIQQMTSKAQAWEHRVHVAGGALNLLKTFFYAISWKYQKNGQPVICEVSDDPDTDILLTQGNNRSHPTKITQVKVTTRKRTLGVHLAPNGSNKTEYEYHLAEAMKL